MYMYIHVCVGECTCIHLAQHPMVYRHITVYVWVSVLCRHIVCVCVSECTCIHLAIHPMVYRDTYVWYYKAVDLLWNTGIINKKNLWMQRIPVRQCGARADNPEKDINLCQEMWYNTIQCNTTRQLHWPEHIINNSTGWAHHKHREWWYTRLCSRWWYCYFAIQFMPSAIDFSRGFWYGTFTMSFYIWGHWTFNHFNECCRMVQVPCVPVSCSCLKLFKFLCIYM